MSTRTTVPIILVIMVGCTTDFRSGEPDTGVDSTEDAHEDATWDTHAEVPEEPETEIVEGPVEPEEPCGAPTDDCDGDGLAPIGGDCCDFDDRVHPGQDGWFSEPYYCPDLSWDYDCDFEVEFELADYEDGIDSVLVDRCDPYTLSECRDAEGWIDVAPRCGESAEYWDCWWNSSPYVYECNHDVLWTGIIRCR